MKISEDFFIEEVRSDFIISSKRKKIWAIELELLDKFIEVCSKYKLTYYIMGGTLLGAVRHQGFIPWDDDIDVIMPRKDYNTLLEIGPKEFSFPLFFQTPQTEVNFFRTHIQIRNSLSTGAIKNDRDLDINRGIFIDVFVLDNIPDSHCERFILRSVIKFITTIVPGCTYYKKRGDKSLLGRLKYILAYPVYKVFTLPKWFEIFNRVCSAYRDKPTKQVAHLALGWRPKVSWDSEDWSESIELPFEMKKLNAPKYFDTILKKQYGDYWIIPSDKNGSTHGEVEFDPNVPYWEYFKS